MEERIDLETCKQVLRDAQKSEHGACAGVFLTRWAPKLIAEIERHYRAATPTRAQVLEEVCNDPAKTLFGMTLPEVCRIIKEWEARAATPADYPAILERERTLVAEGVTAVKKAIECREWLTEGRGSYEWDDDRWHGEFAAAITETNKWKINSFTKYYQTEGTNFVSTIT